MTVFIVTLPMPLVSNAPALLGFVMFHDFELERIFQSLECGFL